MNKRYWNTETKQCVVLPSGSDSETIIISTDERVQVAFQSIDKVKFDRSVDDNGYPILLEYTLQEDGTRYSKYLDEVDEDGVYQPDLDGIAQAITEQEQADFRTERNKELLRVDIEINKLEDASGDTTELRVYRQALRDATIDWVMPSKPEGV